MVRLIAAALAGGLLVFVALMVGAALWPKYTAMSAVDADRAEASLSVQTETGLLEAEVYLLADLVYRIDIHVTRDADATGPIRPTVILEMMEMEMGTTEPPLHLLPTGEFHVEGQLPMAGRWRIRIGFGNELHNLEVLVPPTTEG